MASKKGHKSNKGNKNRPAAVKEKKPQENKAAAAEPSSETIAETAAEALPTEETAEAVKEPENEFKGPESEPKEPENEPKEPENELKEPESEPKESENELKEPENECQEDGPGDSKPPEPNETENADGAQNENAENNEGSAGDESRPPEKVPENDFYLKGSDGNNVLMRLIGYSEYRGKIYVIARPENAPKDSTAVFRLFYRRKVLCFKLVRRKRLCEAVFDKYARGFKKVSVKKAGSEKHQYN